MMMATLPALPSTPTVPRGRTLFDRVARPDAPPLPRLVCSDCGDVRTGVQPGTVCWQPECLGVLRLGWERGR